MSKEGLHAIITLLEKDQAAYEACAQGGPQVLLEMARKHNLDVTLEDLQSVLVHREVEDANQAASELSDEDLDAVAGGYSTGSYGDYTYMYKLAQYKSWSVSF